MSNPFVRYHGYYSEVGDVVTVSDDITYLDVISVLDSLNSFFPEDCCDLYSELLDKADIDCSVTNVFKVLHDKMEEDGKEALHRYDDEEDEVDDEDYWFDGDDSIWDTLRMTVKEVTEKFKAAVRTKLKFIDFYANKTIVSEKMNEEELDSLYSFICDFVDHFHETDEYDEIASEFSYQDIQWADEDELKKFNDDYISHLNVLAFFESQMNDESLDNIVKIAISKCNCEC